jgi:uncharacterized protein (UPF0335 family)
MKDNHTPELWGDGNEYPTIPQLEHIINCRASYYKNCGDRAVECAESDLLGQCLEALEELVTEITNWEDDVRSVIQIPIEHGMDLSKAKAILTKRKGEK